MRFDGRAVPRCGGEPAGALVGAERGEELECHRLAQLQVVGAIDVAHPAAAEQSDDAIASIENRSGSESSMLIESDEVNQPDVDVAPAVAVPARVSSFGLETLTTPFWWSSTVCGLRSLALTRLPSRGLWTEDCSEM